MSLKTAIISTTSLVFLAGTATADVTAKDIWGDWKTYMSGFGYAVEAQEAMSGNTLHVTDLNMSMAMPEDAGNFSMTLGKVDFVNNGDGTVTMKFPEVMPMHFAMKTPKGDAASGTVDYFLRGMNMVASGDPDKVTYAYTADQMALSLKEIEIDGVSMPKDALKVEFTSNDISGTSVMEIGNLRHITQDMKMGSTTYSMNFQAPEDDGKVVADGTIASLSFSGETVMPAMMNPEKMGEAMADGFAVNGEFAYTDSSTQFSVSNRGETMSGASSVDSADVSVLMNNDALKYSGTSKGVEFNLIGDTIPLPVSAKLGEMAFNLLIPVSKSDDPSDFAFGLTLGDFTTSEDLWGMLDPGKILPRDPATISLDLTGKAKLFFDLFDPEQMEAAKDGASKPGELNALTLRKLLVSVAGAELTGTGDFTFDNSDLDSFGGVPKPTGGIDLSLVGGNGLMDKLVQMGLLPQEQAMGARMMMGLFARPGEGDDSLTSKIEINEEGHILANGQRIK